MLPVTSLYIHIPFCASKCYYCDFNSYVSTSDVMAAYVDALSKELEQLAQDEHTLPLQTVFLGGGTPSLLPPALLQQLFDSIHRYFRLDPSAEISMEANPGTVTAEKLKVMREGGVNRLSFGVQTLNEAMLKKLGRLHDAAQVYQSYRLARAAGFPSVNFDLMFGLPGQSMEMLTDSLQKLCELEPDHLSTYALKVEEGTPFGTWHDRGQLILPSEDTDADMYEIVQTFLQQKGYEMYEISNFARPGHKCRHNLVYWRNEPYMAAGAGAHGYVNGIRYQLERVVPDYIKRASTGQRPIVDQETIAPAEQEEDTMILGLRLVEGITERRFLERHGKHLHSRFGSELNQAVQNGWIRWDKSRIRLSHEALPIANEVFLLFLES